jgi:hypothetical protein
MKIKINIFINIMMLGCCFGSGFAIGEFVPGYGSAIGWKANQINNHFIDCSSSVAVTRRVLSLSYEFKKFLNTDKDMQKIKKINEEGNTEATLDVTMLEENIAMNLIQKENALRAARDNSVLIQEVCKVVAGVGILGAIVLAAPVENKKNSTFMNIMAVAVGTVTVGGATSVSFMLEKKEVFEKHIKEIQAMQKDWKAFFESV